MVHADGIEIWRQLRISIEHFDNILINIRKLAISLDGALIGSGLTIMLSDIGLKRPIIIGISLACFTFNFGLWLLEKHYHKYLIITSMVCMNIEESLGMDFENRLTKQLDMLRKTHKGPSPYDMIYICPMIISYFIFVWSMPFAAQIIFAVMIYFFAEIMLLEFREESQVTLKSK